MRALTDNQGKSLMNQAKDVLQDMVDAVPGVVAVMVIDSDGLPIAVAGDFDLDPYDLGAMLSACQQSYNSIGGDLGQFWVESITAEFDDLKLIQNRMPRGSLVVVTEKNAPLGVIRMEAKRSIQAVTQHMQATVEARQELMNARKFRRAEQDSNASSPALDLMSYLKGKADPS